MTSGLSGLNRSTSELARWSGFLVTIQFHQMVDTTGLFWPHHSQTHELLADFQHRRETSAQFQHSPAQPFGW